jgi:hypothetical protein
LTLRAPAEYAVAVPADEDPDEPNVIDALDELR